MVKITCLKCVREKEFKNIASIWTEGWQPISKDQYVCDLCSQLDSFEDPLFSTDFLNNTTETRERIKKKRNSDTIE